MCKNTVLSIKNTVFSMLIYRLVLWYTRNVGPLPLLSQVLLGMPISLLGPPLALARSRPRSGPLASSYLKLAPQKNPGSLGRVPT